MKCFIILLVFFIIFCELNVRSEDFKCGYCDDKMESIEFYSTSFEGSVPLNCSTSFLPTNLTDSDKSNVKRLKIVGYNINKINDFIKDYLNLHLLDISNSKENTHFTSILLKHKNLAILNMSRSEFQSIIILPGLNLPNLTEVDLSFNNIERIPTSIFKSSKKLLKINLSHNKLNELYFVDTVRVVHDPNDDTDLNYIGIGKLDYEQLIGEYSSLESLNLTDNPIQSFDCRIFSRVKQNVSVYITWNNIEHLNCTGEHINVVPNSSDIEGLFHTNGTIKLHCNDRSFRKITVHEVNNFTVDMTKCLTSSLKTLYLSGNFTEKLNENTLERFFNLEELELLETKLSNFDFGWLQNQKHLKQLYISKDSFKAMTNLEYVKTFEQLENVTIMENQLQNTAEIFHHMNRSVKYIKISGNFIGELDYSYHLQHLDNLISLSLNDVSLALSGWFANRNWYKNLRFLDISYNNLENELLGQFDAIYESNLYTFNAVYCNLKNVYWFLRPFQLPIRNLSLSGNQMGHFEIKDLQIYDGKPLDKLEYLHLGDMNASNFDIGMLVRSHSLKFLNVSYNNMKTMDLTISSEYQTTDFSQLEELHLEGNDLVDPEHLNPTRFPNLRKLSVAKNQFSCEYLKNLMQPIWQGRTLIMVGDFSQQKNERCTFTNVQNLKWLYITIVSLVLIIITIILSVCFVFRKRIFKKLIPNSYGEPTVLWNGNEGIEISSLPNGACAESISPADHIYESIPDLGYTNAYNRLDFNPRNPNSINIHYVTRLTFKQRQNSI